MPEHETDVKTSSKKFTDWLDAHSRTGWYVAVWALVITVNQFVPFLDNILP